MDTHLILLSIHVVTAVLGVGPLLAMAVAAARTVGRDHSGMARDLVIYSRIIQWALVVMLITGLLLARQAGWVYMHMRWLQLSLVLFTIVGAILGLVNRPLRKATTEPGRTQLDGVRRIAWLSCLLVAVIVVLMVTKPA